MCKTNWFAESPEMYGQVRVNVRHTMGNHGSPFFQARAHYFARKKSIRMLDLKFKNKRTTAHTLTAARRAQMPPRSAEIQAVWLPPKSSSEPVSRKPRAHAAIEYAQPLHHRGTQKDHANWTSCCGVNKFWSSSGSPRKTQSQAWTLYPSGAGVSPSGFFK